MKTNREIVELFNAHVVGNYARLPISIERGKGSEVWDVEGRRYLDFFPGWGVSALGYGHPRVVQAVRRQAERLLHMPNNFHMELQGRLAQALSRVGFDGRSFFCNSGAEANEAAIKLARLWSGGDRYEIITMHRSFHGRTLGAISATGQPVYQRGFGPLVADFKHVAFNDVDAVRRAITPRTCAVMVEPVQGEGGVRIPDDSYLACLRTLCDAHNLLLILDEVQTGIGRTGRFFAWQYYDVQPDVVTLAKALGGGVPIGALLCRPEVGQKLLPGTHASTYGGNPLVCAAALAVISVMEEDRLLDAVTDKGRYLLDTLNAWKRELPGIKEVRGVGLMIGIELEASGDDVVHEARNRGLILNCTQGTVLRLLPAYTISEALLDEGLAILKGALAHCLG